MPCGSSGTILGIVILLFVLRYISMFFYPKGIRFQYLSQQQSMEKYTSDKKVADQIKKLEALGFAFLGEFSESTLFGTVKSLTLAHEPNRTFAYILKHPFNRIQISFCTPFVDSGMLFTTDRYYPEVRGKNYLVGIFRKESLEKLLDIHYERLHMLITTQGAEPFVVYDQESRIISARQLYASQSFRKWLISYGIKTASKLAFLIIWPILIVMGYALIDGFRALGQPISYSIPRATPSHMASILPTWTSTSVLQPTQTRTSFPTATETPTPISPQFQQDAIINAPLDDLSNPLELDLQGHASYVSGEPQTLAENGRGFMRFDPTGDIDKIYFLDRDGENDFLLGNTPESSMTIELYFRPHSESSGNRAMANALWWDDEINERNSIQGWSLNYQQETRNLTFSIFTGGSQQIAVSTNLEPFSANEWVRVKVIKDGSQGTLSLCFGPEEKDLQLVQSETMFEIVIPYYPETNVVLGADFDWQNASGSEMNTSWYGDLALFTYKDWADYEKQGECAEPAPLSTPTPTPDPFCSDALPPQLVIGQRATVDDKPNIPNRLRESPGLSGRHVSYALPSAILDVLDGPICADGMWWWKVMIVHNQLVGWVAEGDAQEYWLIPVD